MASHHTYHLRLHLQRFSWFTLVATGLLVVQLIAGFQPGSQTATLGQTVGLTSEQLLMGTNEQRAAHGLRPLAIDPELSSAAAEKARDMAKRDYWSHDAPDGKTPWYFIEAAGYEYINAGENLAYGFKTSDGVINGWMNSQRHRDNLLGDYRDVGFGFVHSDNFQGGSYTVVVAMYGTSLQTAVAGSVAPEQPMPPPAETLSESQSRVLAWQSIASASAPFSLYASMIILAVGAVGFIYTHRKLLRHSWQLGLRYAHMHPLVDAAILGAIATAVATATIGFIR
jgi:uncharacterized protein YkwD